MKLRLAGTVNRLNPPQADPISMTLRFIDFKTSEPHNFEVVVGWVSDFNVG
jgi:hypothetical protein